MTDFLLKYSDVPENFIKDIYKPLLNKQDSFYEIEKSIGINYDKVIYYCQFNEPKNDLIHLLKDYFYDGIDYYIWGNKIEVSLLTFEKICEYKSCQTIKKYFDVLNHLIKIYLKLKKLKKLKLQPLQERVHNVYVYGNNNVIFSFNILDIYEFFLINKFIDKYNNKYSNNLKIFKCIPIYLHMSILIKNNGMEYWNRIKNKIIKSDSITISFNKK